jgi:putative FmdB family regulatory protein
MPTFDFICENCGFKIDQFVAIGYPKISKCPKCSKKTLIRCVGTGSGIIFKGDGWTTNNKQISDAIKENNKMNDERKNRSIEDKDF